MKNKTKLKLMNVLVLILCLGALMFGVYSVSKTAKLEVSGTVGLKVHYAQIEAEATIKGDAVITSVVEEVETYSIDPDGYPSPERTLLEKFVVGSEEASTADIIKNVGKIYFTDLTDDGVPENITLKFTITNRSNYDIALHTTAISDKKVESSVESAENYVEDSYVGFKNTLTTYLQQEETAIVYVTFTLLMDGATQDYITLDGFDFEVVFKVGKYDNKARNTFLNNWKSKFKNAGIDTNQITDISFENTIPDESVYTVNSAINDGEGIETYLSSDNKKVVFYNDEVINVDENASGLFSNLASLTNITFNNFNTANVTDMSGMFAFSPKLKALDLTGFDMTNVTTLATFVYNCSSIESIDLTGCAPTKLETLNHFACDARSLTTVIFGENFTSNRLTDMQSSFARTAISNLDLSMFNFANVEIYFDLFCETYSIRHTNAIKVANQMQYDYFVGGIHGVNYWHYHTIHYKNNNQFSDSYAYFE